MCRYFVYIDCPLTLETQGLGYESHQLDCKHNFWKGTFALDNSAERNDLFFQPWIYSWVLLRFLHPEKFATHYRYRLMILCQLCDLCSKEIHTQKSCITNAQYVSIYVFYVPGFWLRISELSSSSSHSFIKYLATDVKLILVDYSFIYVFVHFKTENVQ